jgi:glycosyltransferase involved in cell wall biosynthesis
MRHKIRILHIITNLSAPGGAELTLQRLVSGMDRECFETAVVSLMGRGAIGEQIEASGVSVYSLGMPRGKSPALGYVWRLAALLRSLQPQQIVQGWLYHGNLAAAFAGILMPRPVHVLWNNRHTPYDLSAENKMTALIIRLEALLSKKPTCIIYNSRISAQYHERLGYVPRRQIILPNGFDTKRFAPSSSARFTLRQLLNLPQETPLIGMVARYHPLKDHAVFIQAAARLNQQLSDVHFVLVGPDVNERNIDLMQLIHDGGLYHRVHLLGERSDIPEITAGLDIASLSSWSEAFPNVVAEAMACGVPCVVTDVGDAAWIVDGTGIVVPARNPDALASGWARLIGLGTDERITLGIAARQRIIDHFSLAEMVRQYEKLYIGVLAHDEKHLVDDQALAPY